MKYDEDYNTTGAKASNLKTERPSIEGRLDHREMPQQPSAAC